MAGRYTDGAPGLLSSGIHRSSRAAAMSHRPSVSPARDRVA